MSEPQATIPDLLTPKQVTALFGVCRRTLTNWSASGRLPAVRITRGVVRYRRSDVLALLGEGVRSA